MKLSQKNNVIIAWLAVLALFLLKPDSTAEKFLLGFVVFGAIFRTYFYLYKK